MNAVAADYIKPGTEVLIKRACHGRFRFHGYDYSPAVITRVTKAHIFVRMTSTLPSAVQSPERDYKRATLVEVGGDIRQTELVVDPVKIQLAHEEQAAKKARRALENDGVAAFKLLEQRFGSERLCDRSDEEVHSFIAAVQALLASEPS